MPDHLYVYAHKCICAHVYIYLPLHMHRPPFVAVIGAVVAGPAREGDDEDAGDLLAPSSASTASMPIMSRLCIHA